MTPSVSVVTLTKYRPGLLVRAVASVAAQVGVHVQQIVIGDDCDYLADSGYRRELTALVPDMILRDVTAAGHPELPLDYLPARLAYLRNLGTRLARGQFIAQLDDDNAFQSDHLCSLVTALTGSSGAEVAHSWRRILNPDGSAYDFRGADPWHPVPQEQPMSYQRLLGLGVFVPGSNEVRDTLVADGRVVARVDTSEYLIRRELLDRIPFPQHYSRWRRQLGYTEDVAFGHELIRRKVAVVATERATLDYYMGGYSNQHADGTAA